MTGRKFSCLFNRKFSLTLKFIICSNMFFFIRKKGSLSQLFNLEPENYENDGCMEERRERKRKSRWSTAKAFVPGMPTILPSNIDDNQRESYLRKYIFSKKNFIQKKYLAILWKIFLAFGYVQRERG